MKTIIRKTVLVAFLLGTLNSYAMETTLVVKKGAEANVSLVGVKKGQNIYIKNSEGKILYKKAIKESSTIDHAFDFTSLQNGYYTLEINKDFQIEVIPFTVVAGKTTFYNKEEKTLFKPVIRTSENRLLVSKLNFEATPVNIKIYFEGDVIFQDTVKGNQVLQRVYKLRKDIKGDYKVVMKANDRIYTNKFSL